jgi:hypothetical protein
MAANKDGHYFENEIELGLDVYFKYKVKDEKSNVEEITRGIGHKDEHGNHKSFVPKKEGRNTGFLEFDMTDVGKDFVLLIKLNDIPVNKGYRGIQIFPGTYLGKAHHFEYKARGNKLFVVVHYVDRPLDSPREQHIDPKVDHPDPPSDIELFNE